MERLLVIGVETVAGANIAATLSSQCDVLGLSNEKPVLLANCQTAVSKQPTPQQQAEWVERFAPDCLILTSRLCQPGWIADDSEITSEEKKQILGWVKAATEADCKVVFVSTDAVFSGPWMFHEEDSVCFSEAPLALEIRQLEKKILAQSPTALITRSHLFGWSVEGGEAGWIDQVITAQKGKFSAREHSSCYATPILATEYAEILGKAIEANLCGLHHISGGERVSPLQFARKLAEAFEITYELDWTPSLHVANETPEYGKGETSLQSIAIRRTLEITQTSLQHQIELLQQQQENGYCDNLMRFEQTPLSRAA